MRHQLQHLHARITIRLRIIILLVFLLGLDIINNPSTSEVKGQSRDEGKYTLYLPLVMKQEGTLLAVTPLQPAPYQVGQSLRVDIRIFTASQARVIGVAMTFNPNMMSCQSIQPGPFFMDWATSNNMGVSFQAGTIDNQNGVITDSVIRLTGKPANPRQPLGPSGSGTVLSYDCTITGAGISYLNLTKAIMLENDGWLPDRTNVEIQNARLEVNVLVSSVGHTHVDAVVEPVIKVALEAELPKEGLATRTATSRGEIQVFSNSDYQVEVIQPGVGQPLAMQAFGFRMVKEQRGTLLVGYTAKQVNGERTFALDIYAVKLPEQSEKRVLIYHGFILI